MAPVKIPTLGALVAGMFSVRYVLEFDA